MNRNKLIAQGTITDNEIRRFWRGFPWAGRCARHGGLVRIGHCRGRCLHDPHAGYDLSSVLRWLPVTGTCRRQPDPKHGCSHAEAQDYRSDEFQGAPGNREEESKQRLVAPIRVVSPKYPPCPTGHQVVRRSMLTNAKNLSVLWVVSVRSNCSINHREAASSRIFLSAFPSPSNLPACRDFKNLADLLPSAVFSPTVVLSANRGPIGEMSLQAPPTTVGLKVNHRHIPRDPP
jgi:hypothetical protein